MEIIDTILKDFPITAPYRFVDEITYIDMERVEGNYTFKKEEFFYKGHFPSFPVTPGTILTEAATQVGLLVQGMYLLYKDGETLSDYHFVLLSSNLKFRSMVLPEETIYIKSQQKSYKRGLLRCSVKVLNKEDKIVCKGELSGQIIKK